MKVMRVVVLAAAIAATCIGCASPTALSQVPESAERKPINTPDMTQELQRRYGK